MSGLDKNRKRNQTVCFRATLEERREIEARITVSGIPKGEYYRQSLLHQQIDITAGKFHSDRIAVEIKRLRERLDEESAETGKNLLEECKALLEQLIEIGVSKNE